MWGSAPSTLPDSERFEAVCDLGHGQSLTCRVPGIRGDSGSLSGVGSPLRAAPHGREVDRTGTTDDEHHD